MNCCCCCCLGRSSNGQQQTSSHQSKYLSRGSMTADGRPFEPNGPEYRLGCCHVRKFTVVAAIVEIFIICFLLVAVVPDLNGKLCDTDYGLEDSQSGYDFVPGNESVYDYSTDEETSTLPATPEETSPEPPTTVEPSTLSTPYLSAEITTLTSVLDEEEEANSNTSSTGTRRSPVRPGNPNPLAGVLFLEKLENVSVAQTTTVTKRKRDVIRNMTSDLNGFFDPGNDLKKWVNSTGTINRAYFTLSKLTCNFNTVWILWAFMQLAAASVMFYGIRTLRYWLFIPHITLRILMILAVTAMCSLLVLAVVLGPTTGENKTTSWLLAVLGFLLNVYYVLVLRAQFKCAHFVKRSSETGFSLSNTRAVTAGNSTSSERGYHHQPTAASTNANVFGGTTATATPVPAIPLATFNYDGGQQRPASVPAFSNRMTDDTPSAPALPPLRHHFGIGGIGR